MIFTIDHVSYKDKGEDILDLNDLTIEEGQNLLLLGPSGCGKTTLLNLLAGLLKPTSGDISYNNTRYASLSDTETDKLRAENFGFVFQRLHLIGHLNVTQNIALAQSKPAPNRIKDLLDDLGLADKAHKKARDLSVGEAQRVAIARALANSPRVIFADEPTSALDDANTEKVINMIFKQAQKNGATLIVATHDARIKGRFDQILEMSA